MDASSKNCCVWLVVNQDDRAFIETVANVKKHLAKTYIVAEDEIFTLAYMNWAAMSMFNASMINAQHRAMGELVCKDNNSAGVALMPTYARQRGQVHRMISEALDKIAAHGVNLDRQLCLYYSQRSDHRNDRPSLVTGNLVLASDETKHTRIRAECWVAGQTN